MPNYCAIIPEITTPNGDIVESKLFKDILAFTKNDREKTKRIYLSVLNSKSDFKLDDNGEPLFSSVKSKYRDINVNPINRYAAKENVTPREIQLLSVHKEIFNKISNIKSKVRDLRNERTVIWNDRKSTGDFGLGAAELEEIGTKISNLLEEIEKLKENLPNLDEGNILDKIDDYDKLATILMDDIEAKTTYNLKNPEDVTLLSHNYRILQGFKTSGEKWATRAIELENAMIEDVGEYIRSLGEYLNLEGSEIGELSIEELQKSTKDVNFIEYIFNGFGDYPRLEAQLIHSRVMKGKANARTRTIKKVDELAKHKENLETWAKKNKIKLSQAYEMLVEVDQYNRLSLVKPQNKKYYQDRNNAFKDKYSGNEETAKRGNRWLKNYANGSDLEIYTNPKYKKIRDNKELKEFYDFFKKTVKEQYDLLPTWIDNRNDEKLPTVLKEATFSWMALLENIKDKGARRAIWEGIRTIIFGSGTLELYNSDGELNNVKHSELTKDEIRLRMLKEIDAKKKSTDLGDVLRQFIEFTNDYSEMEKALPEVRLVETLLKAKHYDRGYERIMGKDANMVAAVRRYIDAKIVGNTSQKFGKIDFITDYVTDEDGNIIGEQTFTFSDFVKNLLAYTRSLYLSFNIMSGTNNVFIGLFGDLIEASGGEYFGIRDLIKANKIYWGTRFDKESKFNMLMDYIQPLQELGEYQEADRIKLSSTVAEKAWNNRFFLQEKGEDYIQSLPMLAYLQNQKVKATDGKIYSLWDLFSVEDINGTKKVKFNSKLAGFDFTGKMLNDHREKIKYVNRQIHGNYSSDNSSVFQPMVAFQTAMLFKKWIPQAVQQRFQAKRYNYITGKTSEGRFRTLFNVLVAEGGFYTYPAMYMKDILGIKDRLNNPRKLESYEIANFRKAFTESLLLLSLTLLFKIMSPPPPEEEFVWYKPDWYERMSLFDDTSDFNEWKGPSAWVYKSMLEQVNRMADDLANFYKLEFYSEAVLNHIFKALAGSIYKLYNTLFLEISEGTLDHDKSYYKSGDRKGERKDINQAMDLIPVVRQANKLRANSTKRIESITREY